MRKKLPVWKVFIFSLISCYSMAQSMNVTGTVVEDDGTPLYGVNVTVKGTTNGAITDDAGEYSITVTKGQTITYSYVGFDAQDITVGNANVINVTLAPDASVLGEVVVTALGVARDKRALQYSVTEVSGENFTKARENNLGNSLSGRVAGVNVSAPSTGPGGSSRIIIRGNKTLGGQNQPLYVIDGVPMDNSQNGNAGMWGGSDGGDGLSSLNPDDIESITVLKGANAAALYGSRGGNGVINVTTKKGTKRKGIGVEYGLNYVAEAINDQSDLQDQFGQGSYVNGVATKPSSIQQASDWGLQGWGPKYDGSQIPTVFGETRPYSYAGNNFDRFYETGGALTNSVALSGGNGKQNFRMSLADLRSTSIVPNAGFDRTNISFSTNSKFGEKLTVSGKILYSKETAKNRPKVSDSPGNSNEAVWRLPGNINIEDTKGDPNKPGALPDGLAADVYDAGGREPGTEMLSNYSNFWGSNAYWSAYQYNNTTKRDRVTASGQLRYDITDFLYVQGRLSTDFYYTKAEGLTPQGTGYAQGGSIGESFTNRQENNMDAMIGFDDVFGKISVNAFVGGNKQYSKYEQISASGNGFSVPFFHALNSANNRNFGYGFSESGINSVFGSAEVGYNNYLFLTATARQDKFSILNGKDILYPSVGGSFVFSDAFVDAMPSWMSFGKLRASWAQVGLTGSLGAYQTTQPYGLSSNPHLEKNMARFANSSTIANPFVNPALSTETEIGLDLRFLGGRFGLDLGYYDQKTTNDILNASIATSSGFNSTTVNVGELTNKGFEFLFTATPIRKNDFSWDISLNLATNKNEVVSLIPGSSELAFEESRTQTSRIKHIVGQPYGVITGITQKMINGQPVFTSEGLPVRDDVYNEIGQSVARLTGGLNNNFAYKGFNLSFLIDAKFGGEIHSGTNQSMDQWGFSQNSLIGREGQAPLTVSGVTEEGEPLNLTLTPQQANAYWNNLGGRNAAAYIYDASFVKLRQLVLGYKLSREVVSKTPFQAISLSFVGRNLAVLHKNIPNIDPESSYSTVGGAQGLEYFALPATRTYGVSLNITY
ncbi:SusC/RagA family TonB-linked outer membrane protein [Arcticibacterium luteifluviistationis]|uniref:SusC/RagA family TonB-linked outer membrane protein n=1 Tax=Arcticibacterium luteifluviistationis TaxID=1784714 RepID=A0A2Z4GDE6_9BACT|nr:SusC/RagA family TonB-linked outer membrane protein [Arcticibacterium luteifluviistationis]AWV99352.1 SusC/RagA family TonB-linked outer membrane protein [Arcticibacterium luteifluviistationis]